MYELIYYMIIEYINYYKFYYCNSYYAYKIENDKFVIIVIYIILDILQ